MAQPMPISCLRSENVTPIAKRVFLKTLVEREKRGIETYGVSLQTHNGRSAIRDAIEEAVDLFQYLVQVRMENAEAQARAKRLERTIAEKSSKIDRQRNQLKALGQKLAAAQARIRELETNLRNAVRGAEATLDFMRKGEQHAALMNLSHCARFGFFKDLAMEVDDGKRQGI